MTHIQWTDETWNPVVGCSIVSKGCTNCYAMKMAARLEAMHNAGQTGLAQYAGTTQPSKAGPVWTGKIGIAPDSVITKPLRTRRPTKWFVNSMSDLWHPDVPDALMDRVFAIAALTPQHIYQILTKRQDRMREYLTNPAFAGRIARVILDMVIADPKAMGGIVEDLMNSDRWPVVSIGDPEDPSDILLGQTTLPNVWLGVSVEDQATADERIPVLLNTPAALRWISAEPLLGPIDLTRICLLPKVEGSIRAGIHIDALGGKYVESGLAYIGDWDVDGPCPVGAPALKLDWVVAGGENGPRPMHPSWPKALRDQCAGAGKPFFFKQWGSWKPICEGPNDWSARYYRSNRRARAHQDQDNIDDVHGKTCTVPSTTLHNDGVTHGPADRCAYAAGKEGMLMFKIGKKAAGDLLDGVQHHNWPEVAT